MTPWASRFTSERRPVGRLLLGEGDPTGKVSVSGTALSQAETIQRTLLGLDAADALQPYLPTRYWLAFVDLFRDPIRWGDVLRGLASQSAYLVVFLGAAWANFGTKDVDS